MQRRFLALGLVTSLGAAACSRLLAPQQIASPRADRTWLCRDGEGDSYQRAAEDSAFTLERSEGGSELTGALMLSLRPCMDVARTDRTRGSRIAIELALDAEGHVRRSCVGARDEVDPLMVACVSEALARLRIPFKRPGTTWRTEFDPDSHPGLRPVPILPARCVDARGRVVPDSPPFVRLRDPDRLPERTTSGPGVPALRGAAVDACYAAMRDRDRYAFGRAAVVVHRATDGTFEKVCTEAKGIDATMRTCIEDALRAPTTATNEGTATIMSGYAFVAREGWPWRVVVSGPAAP